jgi:hypothetical protein
VTDWAGLSSKVQASHPADPAARGLNPLAVAAFTIAMFVGVLAPVTGVMGLAAQAQIRSSGQAGAGLARAAVIISGVYLVLGLVVAALYFLAVRPS